MSKNVDTLYPLTPLQHGMLHHSQRDRASGLYVEQFSCVLAGPLDTARFAHAWQQVVQRHDVLKTLFIRLQEPRPVQVVRRQVTLPLRREDWSGLDPAEQQRRFEQLLLEDRAQGFDPAAAPLMRLCLVALGSRRHRFLWTYHHAILDGWSMPVLLAEVFALYGGHALPTRPRDYRHYVAWLQEQDRPAALAFWRSQLQGLRKPLRFAPSLAPASVPAGPRRLATHQATLPPQWAEAAQQLCRAQHMTLNTLCQGAWALLLGLYADTDDVVHGVVVSGRSADVPGLDTMVGLFIATLPSRTRLDGHHALADWLRDLQSTSLQQERHAHCPLPDILQCADVPRQQPLFDALYVFENYPGQAAVGAVAETHGLAVEDVRAVEQTNYGLALIVLPSDGLQCQLTFDAARFEDGAAARLLRQYTGLLQRIVAQQARGDLRSFALQAAPLAGLAEPITPKALHERVLQHAERAPHRLACAQGPVACDYRSLGEQVLLGMRRWAALGCSPGERVLLLTEGGVPGLAMLLSGLAFGLDCVLPDPAQPWPDRLSLDLAACGDPAVRRAVSDTALHAVPPGLRCDRFDLIEPSRGRVAGDAALGTCSLLAKSAGEAHEWTLLRYGQAQLAQALDLPRGDQTGAVAVCGMPLAAAHLWTALATVAGGGELHAVGQPGDGLQAFAEAVQAVGRQWTWVQLDGAQTRQLAQWPSEARLPTTAGWRIDAASASAGGLRRLHRLQPAACIEQRLCWPAHSLPHAITQDAGVPQAFRSLAEPSPGSALEGLDRHLNPAGTDARARLAVRGASVPQALLLDGRPLLRARRTLRDGPLLLTPIETWCGAAGRQAALPDPLAGCDAPGSAQASHETALRSWPGVQALALLDRLDSDGEWRSTIFFAAAAGIDGLALRDALRDCARARGLGDADCIELRALPGDTGRIDRAALARGEVAAVERREPVAPRDEIERTLQAIWCELLKREHIGVHDDYFDLGGQSLLATVMLYQVQERLGCNVDIEVLLRAPTIAGLAEAIRDGSAATAPALPDLRADAVLADDVRAAAPWHPAAPIEPFLTGATGFLGAHLLADLLEHTPARVHCLVRARDEAAGRERLVEALRAHGLWRDEWASRVVAVPGELGQPHLGLSEAGFAALAERVDAVYHNGAQVNFVYPYANLKPVNVLATQQVLRLAGRGRVKPVHYVSTVGVLDRAAPDLPELLEVPLHERLMGAYEQSKWVAEQLVCEAARRGLPVTLYRLSRIIGHSRTGRMNTDDLFCRLIKGIVLFGQAPVNTGHDNMLPVDLAARMIVEASLQPESAGHAVHVVNPHWTTFDALVDFIETQGHPLQRTDYPRWLAGLREHVRRDPAHPLATLMPVLRKLDPVADPTIARRMPIRLDHLRRWAPLALAALPPQPALLSICFDYLYRSGYLPHGSRR